MASEGECYFCHCDLPYVDDAVCDDCEAYYEEEESNDA